jgi:HK97 family phage portal protein
MGFVSSIAERARPQNLSINEYLRRRIEPTWSGMDVSPKTALQVSAVFACNRVIAEDIGKLPFVVYNQTADRERERAVNSPFWRLLHDRPNSYQTSQQFREYLTSCALLRGNGYALKGFSKTGQVSELLPLAPDTVRVEQLPDWELVFHVTLPNGTEQPYTRKEIFHLPGLTIAGPTGVSVIEYARQSIGTSLGASRHAGTFFGNGMKPSSVFMHPTKLSDSAHKRLKEDLNDKHNGPNSNNTLLLEEGMKFEAVSLSGRDAQFLESRTFEVLEICRWFRIKPHKIAELSRATFSNIEQEAQEHVTDTLMPWGMRWESAVNQQVIASNSPYAELLYDSLLRGTTIDRYNSYQIAAGGNAPFMTRNEIRRRENLSPLDGLDDMLQPLNMGATGQQSASNQATGG